MVLNLFNKNIFSKKRLGKLIETFRKAGADLITLTCPVEAKEAKKLYDKHDFEIGAYYMKKKL